MAARATAKKGRARGGSQQKRKQARTSKPQRHYGGIPAPIEEGSNSGADNEVQEYFDQVHELTDSMESSNGAARAAIKDVWDQAAEGLGYTKSSLKFMFGEQRRARKNRAKLLKMDSRDRESIQKAADAFGATGFGSWLADQAAKIPEPGSMEGGHDDLAGEET